MPTIELVSLRCPKVPALPIFSTFGYLVEPTLRSHRALFQPIFDQTTGVIVHLGNKDLEQDWRQGRRGCFAGDLVDWGDAELVLPAVEPEAGPEQWWGEGQAELFRFHPTVLPELRQLIKLLLARSPVGKVYLSTDYQFGPASGTLGPTLTLKQLVAEHDAHGLRWNCLYTLAL